MSARFPCLFCSRGGIKGSSVNEARAFLFSTLHIEFLEARCRRWRISYCRAAGIHSSTPRVASWRFRNSRSVNRVSTRKIFQLEISLSFSLCLESRSSTINNYFIYFKSRPQLNDVPFLFSIHWENKLYRIFEIFQQLNWHFHLFSIGDRVTISQNAKHHFSFDWRTNNSFARESLYRTAISKWITAGTTTLRKFIIFPSFASFFLSLFCKPVGRWILEKIYAHALKGNWPLNTLLGGITRLTSWNIGTSSSVQLSPPCWKKNRVNYPKV